MCGCIHWYEFEEWINTWTFTTVGPVNLWVTLLSAHNTCKWKFWLHTYVSGLDLADHCCDDQQLDMDILIGCDHYWRLVTSQVICKGDGPTAVHTRLEWVLSGLVNETVWLDSAAILTTNQSLLADTYVSEDGPQDLDRRLKTFWDLEPLV